MAVPAHDTRDFEFARVRLPITCIRSPTRQRPPPWRACGRRPGRRACWPARGRMIRSANAEVSINGLPKDEPSRQSPPGCSGRASARQPSTTNCATGCSAGSATGVNRSPSCTWRMDPEASGRRVAGATARDGRYRPVRHGRVAPGQRHRMVVLCRSGDAAGRRRETHTMPSGPAPAGTTCATSTAQRRGA